MGTLDFGRDQTDVIVRELGQDWWEEARKATPNLIVRALKAQASAHDVDFGYLRWIFIQSPRSWNRRPGSGMLTAARRLYLEAVNKDRDDPSFNFPDEDMERRVDKALAGLIRWGNGDFTDEMAEILVRLMKPAAERAKAALWEDYQDRYTTMQARSLITGNLPLRVRDHPHWFRDPTTLHLLLQGVIG